MTNGLQALIVYLQLRFSGAVNTSVAVRLFEGFLGQPYEFYIKRNSSELQACVQAEAVYVQSAILQPTLQIIQKSFSVSLLLVAIVVANPLVALAVFVACGGMYGLVFLFVRKRLKALGEAIGPANQGRYKAATEAFGSPKLTKLMHLESFFCRSFAEHTQIVNLSTSRQGMYAQIPRFALEGLAFAGILLIAISLIATANDFSEVIPVLGFYAFAGYRLMPAIQLIYSAVARLQFGWSRLLSVHKEYLGVRDVKVEEDVEDQKSALDENLDEEAPILELRSICFKYESATEQTLSDISLSIKRDTTVGLCGTTGAGKTTMLDILLGLLEPGSGEILANGVNVTAENRRQWQRQIGYVPQEISLTDTSITENIAFGINPKAIDRDLVRKAAGMAGISEFIEDRLPESYDTKVGERGTRLSGGQRQRIGIARALYRQPRVLVFDEATSSLDNETEKTVMNAIKDLSHKITIVMVAHRINTLRPCEIVYRLERGKIVRRGPFEEMFAEEKAEPEAAANAGN
jgi:ATP-binding cassette subfamily C protein